MEIEFQLSNFSNCVNCVKFTQWLLLLKTWRRLYLRIRSFGNKIIIDRDQEKEMIYRNLRKTTVFHSMNLSMLSELLEELVIKTLKNQKRKSSSWLPNISKNNSNSWKTTKVYLTNINRNKLSNLKNNSATFKPSSMPRVEKMISKPLNKPQIQIKCILSKQ